MNAVFKFSNCLSIFHPRNVTVVLLLDVVDGSLAVFLVLPCSIGEGRFERLDVESGLNKLFLGDLIDNSKKVEDHIFIEQFLGLESLEALVHYGSPFLHLSKSTSGEMNRTRLSLAILLALRL